MCTSVCLYSGSRSVDPSHDIYGSDCAAQIALSRAADNHCKKSRSRTLLEAVLWFSHHNHPSRSGIPTKRIEYPLPFIIGLVGILLQIYLL